MNPYVFNNDNYIPRKGNNFNSWFVEWLFSDSSEEEFCKFKVPPKRIFLVSVKDIQRVSLQSKGW